MGARTLCMQWLTLQCAQWPATAAGSGSGCWLQNPAAGGDSLDYAPQSPSTSHDCWPTTPPRRVFAIFGSESSGTKLVARLIAHAAGVAQYGTWRATAAARRGDTEVHHFSLPWGATCAKSVPPIEREWNSSARWPTRSRFFLGATSHVQAYASSGADAIAVLVVREPLVATQSKLSVRDFIGKNGSHHFGQHCANATMAATEDEISHSILRAALRALPSACSHGEGVASRHLVSYEAIVALQGDFVNALMRDLGLDTYDNFMPHVSNMNAAYLKGADNGKPEGALLPARAEGRAGVAIRSADPLFEDDGGRLGGRSNTNDTAGG